MFTESRNTRLPKVFIHDAVKVKESPIHRWGCFTTEDIPKGTIIESAPVLIFHRSSLAHLFEMNDSRHILQDYPFTWEPGTVAIAFGFASIYNHSNTNNCVWRQNYELETLEFITRKDIKAGEEIFVKYLPSQLRAGLWFSDESEGEWNISIDDMNEAADFKRLSLDWKTTF
jgi:uncharacterized protein